MLRVVIVLAAVAVCQAQLTNRYQLFTRANQNTGINITTSDESLPSLFNPEERTIILIHGHRGSGTHRFNTLIKEEIFRFPIQDNIIVVDWGDRASGSYSVAVSYVQSVANDLANFLRRFGTPTNALKAKRRKHGKHRSLVCSEENLDFSLDTLHLVGFDLGAHIAGIASRQLIGSVGTVARITGLDPSGSSWGSNSARLRSSDASYVEVIHTDGSGISNNGIGTNIGAVNFQVNGGYNQPGCFSYSCSHDRAYELFAASMRGGHLIGRACRSSTQVTLNLCRGDSLEMGGVALSKPKYNNLYRVNTGRNFPF